MTIAFHRSHCATKEPVAGLMHEPVANPSLFLDNKETSQDLFHWPKFDLQEVLMTMYSLDDQKGVEKIHEKDLVLLY